LNYEIYGQGKPLVFLHGFLEDSSIWDDIWPEFKKTGYKVITVDLPCHGESRFSGEKCSMTEMAEGVNNILHTFKIEYPTIIGHSMGGYVGLELLRLLDARLFLVHSNFWADSKEKKLDRNRVISIMQKGSERFIREAIPGLFADNNKEKCENNIESLIRYALQIPANEIAAATAGIRDRRSSHDLMEKKNVSIIQGELDPIIPTVVLEEELTKIKRKPTVVTIPNCGHMSLWEDKKTLISELTRLLSVVD
jgi:pimeloyl-ACP methyl ester carboxylesterase